MNRFCDTRTKEISEGQRIKGFSPDLIKKAKIKIIMILSARDIKDLMSPPSNRLEKLKGTRKEQYSVRINDQYRICFEWVNGQSEQIEFVDYH